MPVGPGSLVVGYAPDGLGRPTQAGTFASNVTYYPNGAMAGFTYGNGIVHTMTQNARQLPVRSLDSYVSGGATTKVLDDSYTYDANGNVLKLVDASNAPSTANRTWGVAMPTLYDGLDRLIAVRDTYQWGAVDWNGYNANYSYDPLDNLRSNQLGASLLTYSYDSSNRLTQLSSGVGSQWTVSHDVRGNITANALRNQAYEFDLAHRLNAVTGKESYLYDGNGRRARTLNLQTGTIEYFGYGADGRLLQDWSNRRQVRNGYIYLGNTLVGLYVVDLTNNSNSAKYQHTDALGSPVVTTNASKTVLSRMSYTPYGMPTLPMDGVGYTGHFVDVGTQLTYMQQRYYDPQIGQFLTNDPVVPNAGSFGRYWYANNSPYRFTDPDGRQSCPRHACSRDPELVAANNVRVSNDEARYVATAPQNVFMRYTGNGPAAPGQPAGPLRSGFVPSNAGQFGLPSPAPEPSRGTLQFGFTVGGSSAFGGSETVGVALDRHGGVAFYTETSGTLGPRADVHAGMTATISNGTTVDDLAGTAAVATIGGGAGPYADLQVSVGPTQSGEQIVSTSVTVAAGAGGGSSIGASQTEIYR